jgi:hypothetical protein
VNVRTVFWVWGRELEEEGGIGLHEGGRNEAREESGGDGGAAAFESCAGFRCGLDCLCMPECQMIVLGRKEEA